MCPSHIGLASDFLFSKTVLQTQHVRVVKWFKSQLDSYSRHQRSADYTRLNLTDTLGDGPSSRFNTPQAKTSLEKDSMFLTSNR